MKDEIYTVNTNELAKRTNDVLDYIMLEGVDNFYNNNKDINYVVMTEKQFKSKLKQYYFKAFFKANNTDKDCPMVMCDMDTYFEEAYNKEEANTFEPKKKDESQYVDNRSHNRRNAYIEEITKDDNSGVNKEFRNFVKSDYELQNMTAKERDVEIYETDKMIAECDYKSQIIKKILDDENNIIRLLIDIFSNGYALGYVHGESLVNAFDNEEIKEFLYKELLNFELKKEN